MSRKADRGSGWMAGPLSGIDLGGGSQGSLGGNNFRSFTTTATPPPSTSAAILLDTTDAPGSGTIKAQKNLFAAGVTPGNEVFPNGSAQIDVSHPLTGNAAFVASLYSAVLRRAGDTSSATDAGSWIALLNANKLTQAQAAAGIIHSAEAGGVLADTLYLILLDRAPTSSERASLAASLSSGATEEQAVTQLVTSAEYTFNHASDNDFVQSLYLRLLGRVGSTAEVNGWVAALPTLGRARVVQDFLKSSEFRTAAVQQVYGFTKAPPSAVSSTLAILLHRTSAPTTAEINAWVNSGLDLLSIEAGIAGSPEFFTTG
jgi:hypothetical protein